MGDELESFLREFWLDLYNRRAMDEMLAHLSPNYAQTDHRPVYAWGESRDDWRELHQSAWKLFPDIRCTDVGPVTVEGDRAAYALCFFGTDAITGGAAEFGLSVVNRIVDRTFETADIFEDHDAALAFLRAS